MEEDHLKNPLSTQEPFYSFHVFLFPFEWRRRGGDPGLLEEQTSLAPAEIQMRNAGRHWERRSSWAEPRSIIQYNEANYFYDFVRPVLYDTGAEDSFQRHYYCRSDMC